MQYEEITARIKSELRVDGVRIVVLQPEQNDRVEANLAAFRPDGSWLWQLAPPGSSPDSADVFVDAWIRDGAVWVATWSCFTYRIDPRSGTVLEGRFTK